MKELVYTDTVPDKEGYYFVYDKKRGERIVLLDIDERGIGIVSSTCDKDDVYIFDECKGALWAGPIPSPPR
jgi:hypothetical protein